MAAARFYSSTSGSIDLTASVLPGDTSITVSTTTGLPGTTPFTLVLDPGTSTEEIVTATNVSGLTITVTRGVDGSSATSHAAGVGNVRHMATARDFREPQEHIAATSNVHGIGSTGSVVGTDTSQTLTNKTAQASAAGVQALIVKGAAFQTADLVQIQNGSGAVLAKFDSAGKLTTPNLPAQMQSGQVSIVLPTAANNVSQGLSFPLAFGGTPRVVVSLSSLPGGSSKATVRTVGTSSTATTLWVENGDGTSFGTTNPVTVDWIAVF